MDVVLVSKNKEVIHHWQRLLSGCACHYVMVQQPLKLDEALEGRKNTLVIVDIDAETGQSLSLLNAFAAKYPQYPFLALSQNLDPKVQVSAILQGAKGCIYTFLEEGLVSKLLACVAKGEIWVDRAFIKYLLSELSDLISSYTNQSNPEEVEKNLKTLTKREQQVAEWVAKGASNAKIADSLFIGERTVKAHLTAIFRKLGIQDRLQLALYINRSMQVLRALSR